MSTTIAEGYRLSPQQKRAADRAPEGAIGALRTSCAIRITGPLDIDVLRSAFEAVIGKHEILRTSYPLPAGMRTPLQSVHETGAINLEERDAVSSGDDQEIIQTLFDRECSHALDMESATIQCTLHRLQTDETLLLFSLPALSCDRVSLDVLLRDLAVAYNNGNDQDEDAEPVQYADVAEWFYELLESDETAEGRAFWKLRTHEAGNTPRLPFERGTDSAADGADATFRIPDSPEVDQAVSALCRRIGKNPETILATAWYILLGRIGGQRGSVLGVELDGRTQEELQTAIGLYARYVPLSIDPDEDRTFAAAADVMDSALDEARQWQDCFHWDVGANGVGSGTHHSRFRSAFVCTQSSSAVQTGATGFEIVRHYVLFELTDLLCEAEMCSDGVLSVYLHYNSTALSASAMAILGNQLYALLVNAAREPDRPIGQLSLLNSAERACLLETFGAGEAPSGPQSCIHRLFEMQAERVPDAAALQDGAAYVSYAELNGRANRIARYLRAHGVGPDMAVGVYMHRSAELVASVLAVLKAGGCFVPLDPDYPAERLAYALQDSGARIVLTQQRLTALLPASGACKVVPVDSVSFAEYPESPDPVGGARPDNRAYIMYTSGSTGKPKGCMIEHRSVCRYIEWVNEYYFGDTDRGTFGLFTSLSFDLTMTSLLSSILRGKTLVILPQDMDIASILAACFDPATRIDAIKLTPSHIALLENANISTTNIGSVIVGGEKFSGREREILSKIDPKIAVYNEYGPTEATVGCVAARIGIDGSIPIGSPITGASAYVVRSAGEPAAIGEEGEICIAGEGLARGYLDRPQLTAERFVPDPFAANPGARLYRTGDIGRWMPDGALEYMGRSDDQVKIRGYRIEPGEVAAVLRERPDIRQAFVAAVTNEGDDPRLAAYCVAATEQPPETKELERFLGERLPAYMLPSAFVFLEELPLTRNGKIDSDALPDPPIDQDVGDAHYEAPRDIIEIQLAHIWESVLKKQSIGRKTDFFALGGHSIVAIQIMSRIQRQFGKNLPLSVLFQNPTIAQLAAALRAEGDTSIWNTLVGIRSHGSLPPIFMAPGAGGNVMYLHRLAQYLGDDQPLYGLQPLGLDGATPPHTSVEEIARHNIREIRTVQPSGPYYLAGHSFGAKVAFEMARQLQNADERIGLVAVIDAAAPQPEKASQSAADGERRFLEELATIIEKLEGLESGAYRNTLLSLSSDEQLEVLKDLLEKTHFLPPNSDIAHVRGFVVYSRPTMLPIIIRRHSSRCALPLSVRRKLRTYES